MPLVENYCVKPGELVLDVCTGSGVIAVFSAYKGAQKVVALDLCKNAVRSAEKNVKLHGFEAVINVRLSNMYEALLESEKFDVITANLPFRDKRASNSAEATMWDTNLETHRLFFEGLGRYLKDNGRVYLSQANFGAVDEMGLLARESGFNLKMIGKKVMPNDPREFYAFELIRR